MKPCKKCFKNNWKYVKLDNDPHIYCACLNCGYQFSFIIPKKKCLKCQKPSEFERIDLVSSGFRGKKCLSCGYVKKIRIASGMFVNGKLVNATG